MRDPPQPLDYGIQRSSPDVSEVKQRLKRLCTIFAILWLATLAAFKVYQFIVNDPSE